MKLGIGGGTPGFRGGISTRGVGVGVGPFSAGTSWRGGRSHGGGGGGVVWVIAIGLVLFLALWPYLLGTFTRVLGANALSLAVRRSGEVATGGAGPDDRGPY
ncbi:hypothetical protein [Mycobacteroides salmoniphilum]|uniref:hypothetical protein n=1 Tax=Mycobacteroides salmoniphilum TaxID=404941 RepID=UPI001065EA77|nr:hypothetical protein [Mycobacteroides salmoniphilum]